MKYKFEVFLNNDGERKIIFGLYLVQTMTELSGVFAKKYPSASTILA
jgi:hypothetical protein